MVKFLLDIAKGTISALLPAIVGFGVGVILPKLYNKAKQTIQKRTYKDMFGMKYQGFKKTFPKRRTKLYKQATDLLMSGQPNEALRLFEQTYDETYKQLSPRNGDNARCLLAIAWCLDDIAEYDAAIEKYIEAINKFRDSATKDYNKNVALACAFNNLGLTYMNIDKYDEAEKYLTQAEDKMKSTKNHYGLATLYNTWGIFYYRQRRYARAAVKYQKSLSMKIKYFGEEHMSTARTYMNLGNLYRDTMDFKIAEEQINRSFQIADFLHSHSKDPDQIVSQKCESLLNLMYLYLATGEYSKFKTSQNKLEKLGIADADMVDKPNGKRLVLRYHVAMCRFYSRQKRKNKAAQSIRAAMILLEKSENLKKSNIGARIHLEKAKTVKKDDEKLKYLDTAKNLALDKKIIDAKLLDEIYNELFLMHFNLSKFQEAKSYYDLKSQAY
jgi:tetratricopeptide (TPR) repeat protein